MPERPGGSQPGDRSTAAEVPQQPATAQQPDAVDAPAARPRARRAAKPTASTAEGQLPRTPDEAPSPKTAPARVRRSGKRGSSRPSTPATQADETSPRPVPRSRRRREPARGDTAESRAPVVVAQPPAVRVPAAKVALSTASVYPESTAAAFEIARRLGYDGIELLVFTDAVSQDPDAVRGLSEYYAVPVLAVHAPCLLVTQRVWGTDPWEKLQRSQRAAERLGAGTVVVHPPFRWQRDYAQEFEVGLARMRDETDIHFAVENMYPWRARSREWAAYQPDWDPRNQDYPRVTLDMSHTAVSGTSALDMAQDLGDRLAHIHLADGTGLARDEHLVPGRGNQQCAQVLEHLAARGFAETVVVEVTTRRAANRAEREADLAEALAFARLHLAAPLVEPMPGTDRSLAP